MYHATFFLIYRDLINLYTLTLTLTLAFNMKSNAQVFMGMYSYSGAHPLERVVLPWNTVVGIKLY